MTRHELEKAVVAKLPAIVGLRWHMSMLDSKRHRVIDVLVSALAENERLKKENVRLRGMCDQSEADIRRLLTIQEGSDEKVSQMSRQIENTELKLASLSARCRILEGSLNGLPVAERAGLSLPAVFEP